jgi:phospholipid/cholesterol/gamma-HCH transport system ATP-binding protein
MVAVIEARDVAIGWSAEEVLVEHASFTVERGEIFGILGRSAAGKSTLLRALIGLEPPLAGEIAVLGAPPVLERERPVFGVMFQQGALFGSMTIGENVALPLAEWTDLPASAIRAVVRSTLALVGLEGSIDDPPSTLSGGMRKRAAIARALALEPQLVFLDEPGSGLDPVTSSEIDGLIRVLAHGLGLTVALVTHDLGTIRGILDRCILLDRDTRSVIAMGTPHELEHSADPRIRRFFERTSEVT